MKARKSPVTFFEAILDALLIAWPVTVFVYYLCLYVIPKMQGKV